MFSELAEPLGTTVAFHAFLDNKKRYALRTQRWVRDTGDHDELGLCTCRDPHLAAAHDVARAIRQSLGAARQLAQVAAHLRLRHRDRDDSTSRQHRHPLGALLRRAALGEVRQHHVIPQVREEASAIAILKLLTNDGVVSPILVPKTSILLRDAQRQIKPGLSHLCIDGGIDHPFHLKLRVLRHDMLLQERPALGPEFFVLWCVHVSRQNQDAVAVEVHTPCAWRPRWRRCSSRASDSSDKSLGRKSCDVVLPMHLQKLLSAILPGMHHDNAAPGGMLAEEVRDVIDPVADDEPAIVRRAMLRDLLTRDLPQLRRRHGSALYSPGTRAQRECAPRAGASER
mmetsp:Transcript_41220/g.132741  ORF Transcript_41220/g.132741 Transcript_41220/m.132741 type:complete len:341 (+) Transcript_41220:783-1805(+)